MDSHWVSKDVYITTRATNSVADIMNAMNKIQRDCISDITRPFHDDIPIKGCLDSEMDETRGQDV